MIYAVNHRTEYRYSQSVSISHHLLHLEPRGTVHQTVERFELEIRPTPSLDDRQTDAFGNPTRTVTLEQDHDQLVIESRSRVRVAMRGMPPPATTPAWEQATRARVIALDDEALDASRFAFASPFVELGEAFEDYARPSFPPGRPLLEAALELNHRIHEDFTFDPAATTLATPVDEVLSNRRGVCQDFTHLMLACLRSLGGHG